MVLFMFLNGVFYGFEILGCGFVLCCGWLVFWVLGFIYYFVVCFFINCEIVYVIYFGWGLVGFGLLFVLFCFV